MKLSVVIFFSALFFFGILLVWQEVKNFQLGYKISVSEEKLRSLEAQKRSLIYTLTLETSKELLISRAQKFGLTVSEPQKVVIIYLPKKDPFPPNLSYGR